MDPLFLGAIGFGALIVLILAVLVVKSRDMRYKKKITRAPTREDNLGGMPTTSRRR
jgi:hypothetical protein